MKSTYQQLDDLDAELATGEFPKADNLWSGADVKIVTKQPPPTPHSDFYGDKRIVLTEHAAELSWLFEKLKDAFYSEELIDSCTKIEFFGRLANAAIRALKKNKDITAPLLCAAVLHEAYAIYEEIEGGVFEALPVAIGNEIVDDYIDEAFRSGFIGTEETIAFFRERGVEVDDA